MPRKPLLLFVLGALALALAIYLLWAREAASADPVCLWREPRRTYPNDVRWNCSAVRIVDGDTFKAQCFGHPGPIVIRVRRLDADERGEPRWDTARQELRRRIEGRSLTLAPHHQSHSRVVADVYANSHNVGWDMDAAGWSKALCPKR
jgi:endonuclease YncB( thermonuclease family)